MVSKYDYYWGEIIKEAKSGVFTKKGRLRKEGYTTLEF
jgi:hypothetical protein